MRASGIIDGVRGETIDSMILEIRGLELGLDAVLAERTSLYRILMMLVSDNELQRKTGKIEAEEALRLYRMRENGGPY